MTATSIILICENVDPSNYKTFYHLIKPCIGYEDYEEFRKAVGISPIHMQMYCDIDDSPSYMGKVLIGINNDIASYYNCTESKTKMKKCNEIDLIIKQAFYSGITSKPWNHK